MGREKKGRRPDGKCQHNHFGTGSECEWWDGGYPECMLPWSHPGNSGCGGNPFACRKFYYRYLASAEKPSQNIIDEFEARTSENVR